MFVYSQSTGQFTQDGKLLEIGYSGIGRGRNNPLDQNIPQVGPIPQGKYFIDQAYDHPKLGPVVMNLGSYPDTKTFGRSLFRIHGNNSLNDASHGCIILSRPTRELINSSVDRTLQVLH